MHGAYHRLTESPVQKAVQAISANPRIARVGHDVPVAYFCWSTGVLSHLSMLETQASNLAVKQRSEEDLKATLEALLIQRDQLKAKVTANTVSW